MSNYNINNPDDISIMEYQFNSISGDEWDSHISFAKLPEHKPSFNYESVGLLIQASKKAGRGNKLSPKQLKVILSLVDKIESIKSDNKRNDSAGRFLNDDSFSLPASHLTLRVAWHDNKWNGTICNDPENNSYCNGIHSLLSERIRKRKDENLVNEKTNKGKSLSEIDYMPPCFWSANLFGTETIKVKHDNPAAPSLETIEEELPPQSILSWPFAVSFTRTHKEREESGAYPKNLEPVRIPRFNAKLHEGKSIAFMYAKFSNPITEEDQQYLVVGAGIIDSKQNASEIKHFGPPSEIDKIKKRPKSNYKYRNFPSINWAMRFSFDDYSTVRMPYHEYLEEAEKLSDDAKDGFLDKIKVAITEPELEWCFKYVAMDIGDDEAIYILTKMRKALLLCKDDGVVPRSEMEERLEKVNNLLELAWSSRSYFPGFVNVSRALLNQKDEPDFPLEVFYEDFKQESSSHLEDLLAILDNPKLTILKKYCNYIYELKQRLEQRGLSIDHFLKLCMLNLRPFQYERILDGKIKLPDKWIKDFDSDVIPSHSTIDIINNPYILCEDYTFWPDSHDNVYGEELDASIDLFKIDIAYFPQSKFLAQNDLQRQIGFIDPRRIRALIMRCLKSLERTGDCFGDAAFLQDAVANYPLYYEIGEKYSLPANFFYPVTPKYANHYQEDQRKLVLVEANDTMYYYLSEIYEAEKDIEGSIVGLLNELDNGEGFFKLDDYLEVSVKELKNRIGKEFDEIGFREERQLLYSNIFRKRFYVIAGSPGSGKSHEVLNIITYLQEVVEQKCLVLAPTGKAALRLSSAKEFSNIEAYTIDKFLTDVNYGNISKSELKKYKNVIIDETSMVDLLKFQKLLKIFDFKECSFARLILVGDPNQLPAIGYGRVLSDIISYLKSTKSFKENFIELETNCRSELKDNAVLLLAEAFKQKGDLDASIELKLKKKETDISTGFRIRYWKDKKNLQEELIDEFKVLSKGLDVIGNLNERLNQLLGLSFDGQIDGQKIDIENFQILTPYHAQYSGAIKLNDLIQTEFKKGLRYELRKNIFKEADKLIRTKNYYKDKELLLSNGTLGIIKSGKEEGFYYQSKEEVDSILFSDIRAAEKEFFELAYAITIHKAQGSGFNHLFLVIPSRFGLLSKELIYTALTRTKKTITIFLQESEGGQNPLRIAMKRSFSGARRTSLLLDKPYRYYDLEPEPGVYVESRVELLIYHMLMKKRNELGADQFNFTYEEKPILNGEEVNIKTDFTIKAGRKTWYWEHLGLITQRKYAWTWQNLKKQTYQKAGVWESVITTDESNGIVPSKIESLIELIVVDQVSTEDKYNKYSQHHYFLR